MFDAAKIHVYNDALGGRSSRSFIEEGLWQNVLDQLRPGDWVMAQFGNNDSGNSKDHPDRTTLKGDGEDTQVMESPVTHEPETIHSYGWYMRQYVNDAKARGAVYRLEYDHSGQTGRAGAGCNEGVFLRSAAHGEGRGAAECRVGCPGIAWVEGLPAGGGFVADAVNSGQGLRITDRGSAGRRIRCRSGGITNQSSGAKAHWVLRWFRHD
jgi:hypothetical protein